MSEPIWNKFLTERDKAVFETSGYGTPGGFGKRPALLVIDVNWAFCGDRPEPILESIKRWRNSCGEDAWVALPYIRSLIDKCHDKGVPVLYTTGVRRDDNWIPARGCGRIRAAVKTGRPSSPISTAMRSSPRSRRRHRTSSC
jgi:maleamate amidohydrolase